VLEHVQHCDAIEIACRTGEELLHGEATKGDVVPVARDLAVQCGRLYAVRIDSRVHGMADEAPLTGAKIGKRPDTAALQRAYHLSVDFILEAVPRLAVSLTVFRVVEDEQLGVIRLGIDVVEPARSAANDPVGGPVPAPGAHVRVVIRVAHGAGYGPHRPFLNRCNRVGVRIAGEALGRRRRIVWMDVEPRDNAG